MVQSFHVTLIDTVHRRCSHVTYLDVSSHDDMNSQHLRAFIKSMLYFKTLKLMSLKSVDDQVLKTIGETSAHLETLVIAWCVSVTGDGLKHLYSQYSVCRVTLKCLDIRGHSTMPFADQASLIMGLPSLVELRCDYIRDLLRNACKSSSTFATTRWLKGLGDYHRCRYKAIEIFNKLNTYLQSLTTVYLLVDGQFDVSAIARLPNLSSLGLLGGASIDQLQQLAPIGNSLLSLKLVSGKFDAAILKSFPILELLNITGVELMKPNPGDTVTLDEPSNLRNIAINCCRNLHDDTLYALIGNAAKLETLYMARNTALRINNVTDAGMESILNYNPMTSLRVVYLEGFDKLTRKTCEMLINGPVKYIQVYKCPNFFT